MSSSSIFDQIPAGIPPPGVKSNLVNPETQEAQIIAIAVVFPLLATITTLIRFYVRIFLTHSLGWDDYFCALSLIVSWINSALAINGIHLGFGVHIWDIRASTLLNESNVRWISSISMVYPIAITFVKVSILLLYYRIFKVNKTFRYIIIGSIIGVTVANAVFTGLRTAITVKCVSLQAIADNAICKDTDMLLASNIFFLLTDFWVLVLPIPSLLGLHLDTKRKIGLMAVFATGGIACILSVVRCIYISLTFNLADVLWTAALSSDLALVELNVAIMVACAPALPKFYTMARKFSTSIYHSLLNRTTGSGRATSLNSEKDTREYQLSTMDQGYKGHFTTRVTADTKDATITSQPMF